MKSGLNFLIASRRCEIEELDQLSHTSELVGAIGRLVHALQKERGISNVLLASGGARFKAERESQIAECLSAEREVRASFDLLETAVRRAGNGARLFSRVAWVLPGLDALPDLRRRIGDLALTPTQATAAFCKLLAGLLAVVFEAADGATDPEISRLLVAMFNFMQGKELAGQERAFGSAAFVSGAIDTERRQEWLHLIEAQERCLQVFREFSDKEVVKLWHKSQPCAAVNERERLRRIGCTGPSSKTGDAALGELWFDSCSQCIDAMRIVEDRLAIDLRARCADKMAQAERELTGFRTVVQALDQQGPQAADAQAFAFFDDTSVNNAPSAYGPQLQRSVFDMMQEQSLRLQVMSNELETARAALGERKLVERAKGLLMAHRGLSEDEAHKMLRQTAMNQNRRLVEVAESVLTMAQFLPDRPAG